MPTSKMATLFAPRPSPAPAQCGSICNVFLMLSPAHAQPGCSVFGVRCLGFYFACTCRAFLVALCFFSVFFVIIFKNRVHLHPLLHLSSSYSFPNADANPNLISYPNTKRSPNPSLDHKPNQVVEDVRGVLMLKHSIACCFTGLAHICLYL